MKLRSTYTGLASGFLVGSSLLVGVISSTSQPQADLLIYIGLIAGFVLSVTSLLGFFGIALRRMFLKSRLDPRHISTAIRQALEVAVLLLVLASLWFLTGLSWWEAVLLIMATIFAEMTIMFRRTNEAR